MAESSSSGSSSGIGFFGLLTIVFIILKLNPGGSITTGVVDWSWWWVLSPLWIPFCLVMSIIVFVFVCAYFGVGVVEIYRKYKNQKV